ncbi:MAG TPA: MFS transporter [Candidatus Limnocylindrales bacterium]|nr:MFS transporter [Candidatus Limnocylindrales bacterium]
MSDTATLATPVPGVPEDAGDGARPTQLLPLSQLARISAYWLGLTAIDAAVGLFVTNRLEFEGLVPHDDVGKSMLVIGVWAAIIGILIQPTVGYISDFTVSRWGRRKPYIVFGSLFDVVFLLGIAMGSSVLMLAGFMLLLSVSTNIARGPFQGYVPDLVAEPQVGLASGMVGLMQVVGNVTGFLLVSISVSLGVMELSLVAVAIVEVVTMASVVLRVGKGLPPKPRHGKSWTRIAREAWATDILRERSYVWLLVSRLLFLTAGSLLVNFVVIYLGRSFGMEQVQANEMYVAILVVVVLANVVAILPSSKVSDRVGRKPLIYVACVGGAVGAAIIAVTPSIPIALVGAALFGAANGTFLAVDWALMTDIIPRASAGRYMGMSNVATGSATPISIAIGGIVLDLVSGSGNDPFSPRAVFLMAVALFAVAAVTLRPVVEPRRGAGGMLEAAAAA